jgi:hypothetical protein
MYLSYEYYTRGQRRSIDGRRGDLSMRRADQRQQLLLLVIIFLPVEVFFVFTHHGFFPLLLLA